MYLVNVIPLPLSKPPNENVEILRREWRNNFSFFDENTTPEKKVGPAIKASLYYIPNHIHPFFSLYWQNKSLQYYIFFFKFSQSINPTYPWNIV